jgi:hypothetical protein
MDQGKFPLNTRQVEVTSVALKMISKPMACSAQTIQLSCVEINNISK